MNKNTKDSIISSVIIIGYFIGIFCLVHFIMKVDGMTLETCAIQGWLGVVAFIGLELLMTVTVGICCAIIIGACLTG